MTTLEHYAEINPGSVLRSNDQSVAFVPMAAVSEDGRLLQHETRPLSEVARGYTPFARGDVLLAKITPCLENGKAALTTNLATEVGFGSTEFHVLRPRPGVDGRFVFHLVWSERFRGEAARQMTGSAGQKRVPASYLRQAPVPLVAPEEQRRIADILEKADSVRRKRLMTITLTEELLRSAFLEMFGDPVTNPKGWKVQQLGDVVDLYAGNSLPPGTPFNQQSGGFLLLKVGDMNLPGNEVNIVTAREWAASVPSASVVAPAGSVVIPKRGGAIATNKKRVLTRPAALDPNLMAIAPQGAITLTYLRQWFAGVDLAQLSNGSTVPQLNKKDLAPLVFQVPPVECQVRFEEFAERVYEMRSRAERAMAAAERLFATLVEQAFSGELRKEGEC